MKPANTLVLSWSTLLLVKKKFKGMSFFILQGNRMIRASRERRPSELPNMPVYKWEKMQLRGKKSPAGL